MDNTDYIPSYFLTLRLPVVKLLYINYPEESTDYPLTVILFY